MTTTINDIFYDMLISDDRTTPPVSPQNKLWDSPPYAKDVNDKDVKPKRDIIFLKIKEYSTADTVLIKSMLDDTYPNQIGFDENGNLFAVESTVSLAAWNIKKFPSSPGFPEGKPMMFDNPLFVHIPKQTQLPDVWKDNNTITENFSSFVYPSNNGYKFVSSLFFNIDLKYFMSLYDDKYSLFYNPLHRKGFKSQYNNETKQESWTTQRLDKIFNSYCEATMTNWDRGNKGAVFADPTCSCIYKKYSGSEKCLPDSHGYCQPAFLENGLTWQNKGNEFLTVNHPTAALTAIIPKIACDDSNGACNYEKGNMKDHSFMHDFTNNLLGARSEAAPHKHAECPTAETITICQQLFGVDGNANFENNTIKNECGNDGIRLDNQDEIAQDCGDDGYFDACDEDCWRYYVPPDENLWPVGNGAQCKDPEADPNGVSSETWDYNAHAKPFGVVKRKCTGKEPGDDNKCVYQDCEQEWGPCQKGTCIRTKKEIKEQKGGGKACSKPNEEEKCFDEDVGCDSLNCYGEWGECNSDCISTYKIMNQAKNGGLECDIKDGTEKACLSGVDECPEDGSCKYSYGECDNKTCQQPIMIDKQAVRNGIPCNPNKTSMECDVTSQCDKYNEEDSINYTLYIVIAIIILLIVIASVILFMQ